MAARIGVPRVALGEVLGLGRRRTLLVIIRDLARGVRRVIPCLVIHAPDDGRRDHVVWVVVRVGNAGGAALGPPHRVCLGLVLFVAEGLAPHPVDEVLAVGVDLAELLAVGARPGVGNGDEAQGREREGQLHQSERSGRRRDWLATRAVWPDLWDLRLMSL